MADEIKPAEVAEVLDKLITSLKEHAEAYDEIKPAEVLDKFFTPLKEHAEAYVGWTNELPKTIVINPEIIAALAKTEGFYQRPELAAQVSAHAPIVRYIKLPMCVVTIREDWDEKFYHFE